jgi:hypothetical protein
MAHSLEYLQKRYISLFSEIYGNAVLPDWVKTALFKDKCWLAERITALKKEKTQVEQEVTNELTVFSITTLIQCI